MLKHNIRRETELLSEANSRKTEGQKDLANFILSKSTKTVTDLIIENTWKMHNASKVLERENISRIQLIRKHFAENCVTGCERQWVTYAREVLALNKVNAYIFAAAIRELLSLGRGKFRNVIIVGPANSGKTILLKPLERIYKVFCNPSNDKCALDVVNSEM